MSKNTNCLAGMECPKCGSLGPFKISATSVFEMHDDGSEAHGDVEFDDQAHCSCKACGYSTVVRGFKAAPQNADDTLGEILEMLDNTSA